jgi:hypothetical protein
VIFPLSIYAHSGGVAESNTAKTANRIRLTSFLPGRSVTKRPPNQVCVSLLQKPRRQLVCYGVPSSGSMESYGCIRRADRG